MTDRCHAPSGVVLLMTLVSSVLSAAETSAPPAPTIVIRTGRVIDTTGVDTVEHASLIDDEGIALAKKTGGMTPMHALQAATVNGADAIGFVGQIGTIAPGAYADIIAVQGDPLADVSVLEKVGFVMKGGKVYKRP
jgi:imidazolonepropionase-like amidohydrolase